MPQSILKTRQSMSAGRAPEISALPALFVRVGAERRVFENVSIILDKLFYRW